MTEYLRIVNPSADIIPAVATEISKGDTMMSRADGFVDQDANRKRMG